VPDDSWSPSPDEWTQGQEPPEAFLIEPAPPSSEWIEPPKPKPVRKPVHRRRPFRTRHIARPGDVVAGPDFSVAIHAIVDDVKGVLETQAVVPPPSVLDGVGRKLDAAGGEGLRSFLADQGDGSPDTAGMRRLVTRSTPDDEATQAVPPELTPGPPPGDWSDLRPDVTADPVATTMEPLSSPASDAPADAPADLKAGPVDHPEMLDAIVEDIETEDGLMRLVAGVDDGSTVIEGLPASTRTATEAAPPETADSPPPSDWSDLRADVSTPEAVDTLPAALTPEPVLEPPPERPIPTWVAEVTEPSTDASADGLDGPPLRDLLAEHRHFRRRARHLDLDVPIALLRQQVADLLQRDQADEVVKRLPERHESAIALLLREVAEYLQTSRPALATTCLRQADRIDVLVDEAPPEPEMAAPEPDTSGGVDLASLRLESAVADPQDDAVEARLRDPEVTGRLDDLHARYQSGDLETVSHEEVGEALIQACLDRVILGFRESVLGGDGPREDVTATPADEDDLSSVATADAIPTQAAAPPAPPEPVAGPAVWPPEPSLLTLIHRRGRPRRRTPLDPQSPFPRLREQTAAELRRHDLRVVTTLTRELPGRRAGHESADLLTEMGDYLAHSNPDLAVDCYAAAWAAEASHGQALARLANWNELHETPRLDPDLLLAVALQAEAIGHPTTAQAAREQIQTAGPTAWPAPPPPPAPADEKPIVWDP
jgi:hypothetical protein